MWISETVRILSDGARHFKEIEPSDRMEVVSFLHIRRRFPFHGPESEVGGDGRDRGPREIPGAERRTQLRIYYVFLRPFAPVGWGSFSTMSTSKGISPVARMLSDKVSHPDGNETPCRRAVPLDV